MDQCEGDEKKTVGLLTISDLDMVMSFFALSRLGHTVLLLSTRLSALAIEKLMQETGCRDLVYSTAPQLHATVAAIDRDVGNMYEVPTRDVYDVPLTTPLYTPKYDRETEYWKPCLILHSSGSTGFPKPVTLLHRAVCTLPSYPLEKKALTTFPFFHLGGLFSILMPLYQGSTVVYHNPHIPQTAESLTDVIEATKPEFCATVPYLLSLMVQNERSLNALRTLKSLATGGSRLSDEVGEKLLSEGIKLGLLYGATENCIIGETITRPEGDKDWNYLRFMNWMVDHIYMDCVDEKQQHYEAIFLPTLPSLSISNTDFPMPGSWRSKDVFEPHPTIPHAWKYVTRLDDRVTLANSEKVLPLPIEGTIRADPLVRECVVFGVGRDVPGLLVFKLPEGDNYSDSAFIEAIWPTVEDANSRAEGFSQIAKDMIVVLPSHVDYPKSDKGAFIRMQVWQKFEKEINDIYAAAEAVAVRDESQLLHLDRQGLEDFLIAEVKKDMGVTIKPDDDFFAVGVDSLRAIQLRRTIQENIALGGVQLPANIVYNCANVKALADYLCNISSRGETDNAKKAAQSLDVMRELITKYSSFPQHNYMNGVVHEEGYDASQYSAIITGATGSIGAHVLAQLLKKDEKIKTVYCFCRGSNPILRVLESLRVRKLIKCQADEDYYRSRIIVLTAEPHEDNFGLDEGTIKKMKRDVGVIIHSAWPVNFNIPLQSFEIHIRGLKNLIDFSLSVNRYEPAQVHFASSISATLNVPQGSIVPDKRAASLSMAVPSGYAQSKLVSEEICLKANEAAGANTFVLRIGQIVGDTKDGVWNETESYPMMVRAGYHMGLMPEIVETCNWLPVDTLASAMVDISLGGMTSGKVYRVYNLANPISFTWAQFLDELADAGLKFKTVPFAEWRARLAESEQKGEGRLNPAVKLIEHFDMAYGRADSAGLGAAKFEVGRAKAVSAAMRNMPSVIEEKLVKKFLDNWVPKWEKEEKMAAAGWTEY
ncbi:Male sterility, NAD-binding protein [Ascosphaera apis ARSEF 7405]|uniref:Male sterility, NAD-binding protein n=1 Tax=Ascosphaera apis ARSEF 7405 TaxID=392613 RepID=A0A168BEE1_9EURO|nr:Male sterility, NAD-binding protein [Ascosphaera apis ARSEF 7405]